MNQVDRRAEGKLATYRRMRDFEKTEEPSGDQSVTPSDHLRFVIQKHDATRLHYDLRLELDGVFKSWAVPKGLSLDPADKRMAVEVEDHPLDYGDFEGTIPKGQYGGGTVQLWDRGYWAPEGDPHKALQKGNLRFAIVGERLQGTWHLVRRRLENSKKPNWLLFKSKDEYVKPGVDPAADPNATSVASGRTIEEIAAGKGKAPTPFMAAKRFKAGAIWQSNRGEAAAGTPSARAAQTRPRPRAAALMPSFVQPQLCQLVDRAPDDPRWLHEVKFDGYRMQLRTEGGTAVLRTRKGLDWTSKFPDIASAGAQLPDCLIDGEICAMDQQGMPDFPALQAALSDGKTGDLIFFAFDLLFSHGTDLRDLPLSERKQRLKLLLQEAKEASIIRYVEHFQAAGEAVLKSACQMKLEGIVSKLIDAPYRSGRVGAWTKAKCRGGHEVIIGGWTTEGARFRSLFAAVRREGELVYIGRVGTGFGAAKVRALLPRLKAVETDKSPFAKGAGPPRRSGIQNHWARPELVAEVEFGGWTADGLIRQASFKGLREDKPASEIEAETPAPAGKVRSVSPSTIGLGRTAGNVVVGVAISHPNKAMWPEADPAITKIELARYYETVGSWMIEHFRGRPCSIVRTPDGIQGEQFFQRHAMPGQSHLISLASVSDDKKPYLQADTVEALIALAQVGTTEIHPWNCQPGRYDLPGRFVFDLDPAPDVPFAAVIGAARELRDRLETLGCTAFCKTTGGKGLHVVLPLTSAADSPNWQTAKLFCMEVCRRMAADSPDKYLITMAKKDRVGRIFLDYLRNDTKSTAVGPLSTRARPGATVSMPLDWKAVRTGLDPKRYTVRTAPALLRRNRPWAGYAKAGVPLRLIVEHFIATKR